MGRVGVVAEGSNENCAGGAGGEQVEVRGIMDSASSAGALRIPLISLAW